MAHVTNPISGISSECSIFFIEDSFYTHQSFIARLYILYIIYRYEIYISPYAKVLHASIFSSYNWKLHFSFTYRFQHSSSFVSDARTSLTTVNMVIFLASQFNFTLYLFMDRIQCWKLFLRFYFRQPVFLFVWFGLGTMRWCRLSIVGLFVSCRYCTVMVNFATCTEFWVKPIFLNEVVTSV